MSTYYFYLPEGLNAATEYYVDTIRQALLRRGDNAIYTESISEIPKYSNLVAIRAIDHIAALIRRPRKTIVWYQGVTPYEVELMFKGTIQEKPKKWLHLWAEKNSLKKATFPIFVSKAMLSHYISSYNLKFDKYFIMPCFNMELMKRSIHKDRYKKPRFLYAGSLGAWENIAGMLEIYSQLKSIMPNAELAIFTNKPDDAKKMISSYGIDAEIDTLTPQALQHRMAEYKYGLLIRNDNVINNVATPTKINSYMSSGLIPVYSDVIYDYRTRIARDNPFVISFNSKKECIDKIQFMESEELNIAAIEQAYSHTFNDYWNRERYITELSQILP